MYLIRYQCYPLMKPSGSEFEHLLENNCKKDFQLVSSESLKRLCTSCRRELSKHLDGLLQAVDTILDKLIPNAAFKILTGLSFVISEGEN